MSQQVISLTSSDEEDNPDPPAKRKKITPILLPQVTLTLVSNLKKKKNQIETVTLDSDDEIDQPAENQSKTTSMDCEGIDMVENTVVNSEKVDLITLTDDEEDLAPQVKEVNSFIESILGTDVSKNLTVFKMNGSSVFPDKADTVAIIDSDSDTEIKDDKQEKSTEESRDITDTNENIVANAVVEEIVKEIPIQSTKVKDNVEENGNEINEEDSNEKNEKDVNESIENNVNQNASADKPQESTSETAISIEVLRSDENVVKEQQNEKSEETDSPSLTIIEENNTSIVIDDSDEETEKENHCENVDIEPFPVNVEKTNIGDVAGPSTSSKDESVEARASFKKFLRMVEEKIVDSSFEEILPKKVPIIEKYFKRCGTYVNEKTFEKLLNDSTESIRNAPNSNAAHTAVLTFHKIFEHLKSRVAESTIEIEEDHMPKVKKLEKTLKLLKKRIKQLEEAEVNFDDDEDSSYIMLDRYQVRLNKVYAKYCEYIRRNPYSGRAIHDKISFVSSKYNVINQAISKKYKNSLKFPSYYDLKEYIEKTSKKENLKLSDQEIKYESEKCFKYLGSILQKKRRQELYDSHLDFIEFTEDPATKDISLENVLRKNYSEGKEKIDKLYQKYVTKQEQGEDHVSSDDVETSEASDSDETRKKSGKKNGKAFKKKGGETTKKKNENRIADGSDKNETKDPEYELKEFEISVTRVDEVGSEKPNELTKEM